MIMTFVVGAVLGLGLFLLGLALIPRRAGLVKRLAAFDEARAAAARPAYRTVAGESEFSRRLGSALAKFCAEQGWEFRSLRSSLSLVDRSFENYLATKILLGVFGLIFAPLLFALVSLAGLRISIVLPVWAGLVMGLIFFALPDLELRQKVAQRRRDFRHAVGAFLDLVAMNLSGGRGIARR